MNFFNKNKSFNTILVHNIKYDIQFLEILFTIYNVSSYISSHYYINMTISLIVYIFIVKNLYTINRNIIKLENEIQEYNCINNIDEIISFFIMSFLFVNFIAFIFIIITNTNICINNIKNDVIKKDELIKDIN